MPDNFDFTIIATTIGIAISLFAVVAAVTVAISTWKNSNNKIKDGIIVDLKTALEVKTEEVTRLNAEKTTLIISHQGQLSDLQKQLSELKGAFIEQGKRLEEYKALLLGKDPASIKMLSEIRIGIDKLNAHQVTQETNVKTVADTLAKKKRVTVSM